MKPSKSQPDIGGKMMKRMRLIVPMAVIAMMSIPIHGSAQDEMRFVDNTVFEKPSRSPAIFEHDNHNEVSGIDECNTCHHVYENGKFLDYDSSEDRSCSDCHGLNASAGTISLRNAFHRNCKGCHMKSKAGPVMCAECHQKTAA